MRLGRLSRRTMTTLETLTFDNAALRDLPLDQVTENTPRQVKNACFSRVAPTPLASPRTVAYSVSVMELIDLPESELQRNDFPSYLCGTTALPGAEYAAHCYCGHQFGYFSGQLGDGATMYVGEVVNSRQERWEVQFKGAGKTPFSRTADGRKVLRSSLREFLCSEAMHHLGVPTTRAGSCIVSTDTVVRDILYDGHPINENCTVILRIAPTFLRFGSFEIFKSIDRVTSRVGPSVGRLDLLHTMLDYVLKRFYPHIAQATKEERVLELYREVLQRTASLVAKWQAVGFCHGVLNTDNMSIVGLTIDYGPYGFMETYDPGHVCNGSDNGGRYSYEQQPDICKWNVKILGSMFALVVPQENLDDILATWDEVYNKEYMTNMRSKLGLLSEGSDDSDLITKLFDTMHQTHADFTTTFRTIASIDFTDNYSTETAVDMLLPNCLPLERVKTTLKTTYSRRDCEQLLRIIQSHGVGEDGETRNPLAMFGIETSSVIRDMQIHQAIEKFSKMTDESKKIDDGKLWREWLEVYRKRIDNDSTGVSTVDYSERRREVMGASNPVVVPRNHVLQRAIDTAEMGDYAMVNRLLKVFEDPYTTPPETWMCGRDTVKPLTTVT